ncbi:hypothetical protein BC830DRAFT_1111860 [Chytriomyces sp. MP71]|nr:hypothetical protein BC830DRAFT_1111860 [Chytriomyces sp. MP71]
MRWRSCSGVAQGNDTCHIILRGSNKGSNYEKPCVEAVVEQLKAKNEQGHVMVDHRMETVTRATKPVGGCAGYRKAN